MRNAIFLLMLVLFQLLASCSQEPGTIQAVPLDDPASHSQSTKNSSKADKPVLVIGTDTCGGSVCAEDQACVDDACVCVEGFKQCGSACIPEGSCCADSDCQGTEECVANQCVFSCARVICPTNQVCDESQKRCSCPQDYRFCEVQNKCIPAGFCCDRFDCGRSEKCTSSVYSAHVCIYSKQPFCKYLGDKVSKTLEVEDHIYDITAAEFMYGKKVKIIVDGKAYVMEDGAREKLADGITLVVDEVRELGGKCRPLETIYLT